VGVTDPKSSKGRREKEGMDGYDVRDRRVRGAAEGV
jgi:hypothetical protein